MIHLPATTIRGKVYADGHDGRYALVGVADAPFDALPSYREGGPSTVVVNGWCTSVGHLDRVLSSPEAVAADDGMHTIRAHRDALDGQGITYHALHGTRWALASDANEALYNAGLNARMVYVKDFDRYAVTIDPA